MFGAGTGRTDAGVERVTGTGAGGGFDESFGFIGMRSVRSSSLSDRWNARGGGDECGSRLCILRELPGDLTISISSVLMTASASC
jgi:hypothetical protein